MGLLPVSLSAYDNVSYRLLKNEHMAYTQMNWYILNYSPTLAIICKITGTRLPLQGALEHLFFKLISPMNQNYMYND